MVSSNMESLYIMEDTEQSDVTALTVQLLSAYLGNNTVAPAEVADLIRTTRAVLSEPQVQTDAEPASEVHTPAVSVRKSLANPEYLISLIDGKPYKTLKRHLTSHNLTPETYRKRYNLPASYPMVAPAFAEKRREIAAAIGLGRRPKSAKAKAAKAPDASEAKTSTSSDTKEQASSTSTGKQAGAAQSATTKPKKPRTSAKANSAFETSSPTKAAEPTQGGTPAEKKQARGRSKLKLKLSGAEAVQGEARSPDRSSGSSDNVAGADSSGKSKPTRRMARAKTEGAKPKD
jgi:predicted transcriptional regulator